MNNPATGDVSGKKPDTLWTIGGKTEPGINHQQKESPALSGETEDPLLIATTRSDHFIGPLMELAQGPHFDLLKIALDELDRMPPETLSRLRDEIEFEDRHQDLRNLVNGLEKLRVGILPNENELSCLCHPAGTIFDLEYGLQRIEQHTEMAARLHDTAEYIQWNQLLGGYEWASDIVKKYYPDSPIHQPITPEI
jgi:hypothetical protein